MRPTTISGFKTTLIRYWGLSVSGCLGFPAGDKTERMTHTSGLTVEWGSAANGPWKKAMAPAASQPPDAVIFDLGLPDVDRVEVIGQLHHRRGMGYRYLP